jgi:ABC-type glycerol-3-phosphate transport system permease component
MVPSALLTLLVSAPSAVAVASTPVTGSSTVFSRLVIAPEWLLMVPSALLTLLVREFKELAVIATPVVGLFTVFSKLVIS